MRTATGLSIDDVIRLGVNLPGVRQSGVRLLGHPVGLLADVPSERSSTPSSQGELLAGAPGRALLARLARGCGERPAGQVPDVYLEQPKLSTLQAGGGAASSSAVHGRRARAPYTSDPLE